MIKILTTLLSLILASVAIASESENFFVRISADKGEITAHADGSFSITPTTTSTTNAINITITPKLDWQLITPRSGKMTVSPSKTDAYRLLSVLGEDSPTGEVHVCSYPVTAVTNHLSSPRIDIDFEVAGSPFIYASPNTGCDISVGGNANEIATGLHDIITTYAPCPKCGSAPAIPKEHSTFETSFDRYSWRITAGNRAISAFGTHISKTLPNVNRGAHQVSATCNATYSQCSLCADSKTQITNAIVSELTIECPPWLGLDRTDAATITTNAAIAHLTPEQDNLSCPWMNGSICQIAPSCDTFRCNIWQPDNNNASSSYLAETITASIGNTSISTNFTVVKVDVSVGNVTENKEEAEGAFLICTNGINDILTDVIFSCVPNNLPNTEFVNISVFGDSFDLLEETENGFIHVLGYISTRSLSSRKFVITINSPSTTLRDMMISLKHKQSDATDITKITNIQAILKCITFNGSENLISDQGICFNKSQYLNSIFYEFERSDSISYVRNTRINLDAAVYINPQVNTDIYIKGICDYIGGFAKCKAINNQNSLIITNQLSLHHLPDRIDSVKPLSIKWFISIDNGQSWIGVGQSTNILYVTWANPIPRYNFQTYFDVGCEAAKGITGTLGLHDDNVLTKIWDKFKSKSIHRVSDNKLLSYYGFNDINTNSIWDEAIDVDYNSPGVGFCNITSPEGLIKYGNGQCFSWASFLNEVLCAQGLKCVNSNLSKCVSLVSTNGYLAFAIKNWKTYDFTNEYSIISFDAGISGTNELSSTCNEVSYDLLGVSGQGNSPNPPSHFYNHFINKIGNKYYDPSYGLGPFNNLNDYEKSSFAGGIITHSKQNNYFLQIISTNRITFDIERDF